MKANKILFVIVTFNAMRWIERCIGSIKTSSVQADIYIIDNGSIDGTQNYIRKNHPEVIFLQSKANLGFGKANNIGMLYALQNDYNFVYLLNQDAWIFEDTLNGLINTFKNHPEYGILSPMQMQANLQHIDRNFKKITCSYGYNKDFLEDNYFHRCKDVYEVPDVMAAHWFIRTDTLKKVGLFSPAFPHYAEDNNYCHRCAYKGIKIGIVPSLQVVHDREYRSEPVEKKIYLFYTQCIASLSNPLESKSFLKWIRFFKEFTKYAINTKSISPFKYLYKLLRDKSTIYKYKKISINETTPFANIKI